MAPPVDQWTAGGPSLGFVPHAIDVVAATGHVYVLSRLPWGVLDRFDSSGQWLDNWASVGRGPGEFQSPEDIAVFADGRIVVADTGNDRMQTIDPSNGLIDASFALPGVRRISVDPSNDTLFALHAESLIARPASQITVYSSLMQELRTLAPAVLDDFAPGTGLAAADDRFAVATSEGGLMSRQGIRQYNALNTTLEAQTLADPLAHEGFLRPASLDTNSSGQVAISDRGLSNIHRYDANGQRIEQYRSNSGGEISFASDDSIYHALTPLLGDVLLRHLAPNGTELWSKRCECLSGMGVAANGSQIFTTDAISKSVRIFEEGHAGETPLRSFELLDRPYAWPLDIARMPDGRALAAGGEDGMLHLVDANAGFVDRWSMGSPLAGAERLSIAPDGRSYVLRLDGQIEVFDSGRQRLGSIVPEAVPGFQAVLPADLAAAAGGRLYVLDRISNAIMVYDETPLAGTPTPTPNATDTPPCTVTGDKVAAPTRINLGETVDLQLDIDIECSGGQRRDADIVMILDRSNSMSGDKLEKAVSASASFIQGLDLSRHRVGIVSFSDLVTLNQELTQDSGQLMSKLAELQSGRSHGYRQRHRTGHRAPGEASRPDALPVILLLTDGNPSRPDQPYVDTFRFGAQARARGILFYTIGLGDDVDAELLTAGSWRS